MRRKFYVYILLCSDGTYYTGITNTIYRRLAEHESGYNKRAYTFSRRPIKLMWTQCYDRPRYAYKMEWKYKKWSASKKKALIEGRIGDLKNLASCLNQTSHKYWKERLEGEMGSANDSEVPQSLPIFSSEAMNPVPLCPSEAMNPVPLCPSEAMTPITISSSEAMTPIPKCSSEAMNPVPVCSSEAMNPVPVCSSEAMNPVPVCSSEDENTREQIVNS